MTILLQRQLDYVNQARIQRFRPTKFRMILPVVSECPTWADRVQHTEVRVSGEHDPVRIAATGPIGELPRPTLSRADAFINIYRFGYSYGYSNWDLERAAQTGINLPATEAVANQGIFERFLDNVAAGGFLATYGMPGLLNLTSTAATFGTPTTTASRLTACTKAGGGTTWAGASLAEIKRDIEAAIYQVNVNTLEIYQANLVILPPTQMFYLQTTTNVNTDRTLLELIRAGFPGVRFETWQRCALADEAGTGPRMVTMATGEDVARMIVPQELRDETPVQQPLHIVVPQWGATAGVLVETPTAVNYTDGI
jgi:hypothetical protein